MFNIVLFEPEIPPNTGNIIRLCANMGFQLHLIEPLGFELDDKRLRRAGLDYAEWENVKRHANWEAFQQILSSTGGNLYAVSTKGTKRFTDIAYQAGDYLLMGPETRGLPENVRGSREVTSVLRIPMRAESRSMNLSNATSVIAYEAWRQLGFDGAI